MLVKIIMTNNYKERIVKNMQKRALMLGFELTPIMTLTSEVP